MNNNTNEHDPHINNDNDDDNKNEKLRKTNNDDTVERKEQNPNLIYSRNNLSSSKISNLSKTNGKSQVKSVKQVETEGKSKKIKENEKDSSILSSNISKNIMSKESVDKLTKDQYLANLLFENENLKRLNEIYISEMERLNIKVSQIEKERKEDEVGFFFKMESQIKERERKIENDLKTMFSNDLLLYKDKYENVISKLKTHFEDEKQKLKMEINEKEMRNKEKDEVLLKINDEMKRIIENHDENTSVLKQKIVEFQEEKLYFTEENVKLNSFIEKVIKEIAEKDRSMFEIEERNSELIEDLKMKMEVKDKIINDMKIRVNQLEGDCLRIEKVIEEECKVDIKNMIIINEKETNDKDEDENDEDDNKKSFIGSISMKENIFRRIGFVMKKLLIENKKYKLERKSLINQFLSKETNPPIEKSLSFNKSDESEYEVNRKIEFSRLLEMIEDIEKDKLRLEAKMSLLNEENERLRKENLLLKDDLQKVINKKSRIEKISNLLTAKDVFNLANSTSDIYNENDKEEIVSDELAFKVIDYARRLKKLN